MIRINLKYLVRRDFITTAQIRCKSSEHVTSENPVVHSSEDVKQKIKEATGGKSKLPQRAPLVKNLMIAKVDKDLLRFPEIISRDDTEKLNDDTLPIQSYFKDAVDAKAIDLNRCVPKEVMDHLKSLGLYRLNIPRNYGGRAYCNSELTVASEPEQASADIATILLSHRVVADVLNEYGSDHQKNKYLSKLADGSIVATEAIFESKPTEAQFFGTNAEYNGIDKNWKLNGEKSFVINGTEANLFLVLAQVKKLSVAGEIQDEVAIFLVDSNMPGVKVDGPVSSFGLRGSQQGTISFKDVLVSDDNAIGQLTDIRPIAQALLKSHRLKTGIVCTGMLKAMLSDLTNYSIQTKHNGIYLKDVKLVSDRLARIVCSIYAIESMTYLTTGLIDEFDNQDVDLEAAITKLYSLENLWKGSTVCMEFMGPKCLEAGQPTEVFVRNSAQVYTHGETIDSLRLYIGFMGLQYAGINVHETIVKDRNPLFHPMHVFKKIVGKQSIDFPKLILDLASEVHPSLDVAAKSMEQSILRLRIGTEIVLGRYGNEIINEPLEVLRITECITLIYAMFASMARASRSYCIGLKNSDYELFIATIIAFEGASRIKSIVTDIAQGPYLTNDVNNQKIAKQLFKNQKYFYEHPLKYNF